MLWLAECLRVARQGAPALIFTDWRQIGTTINAVQAAGWAYRGIIPWDKMSGRPRKGGFRAQCEYVVWATKGAIRDCGVGYLPGVIRAATDKKRLHQVGKPVSVMAELVEACEPGGLILDPFAGSGTTGVAALKSGRRFLGFELVAHYAGVARERLAA